MYRPVGNTSKGEETFTRICLWNVRVYRMTVEVFSSKLFILFRAMIKSKKKKRRNNNNTNIVKLNNN